MKLYVCFMYASCMLPRVNGVLSKLENHVGPVPTYSATVHLTTDRLN